MCFQVNKLFERIYKIFSLLKTITIIFRLFFNPSSPFSYLPIFDKWLSILLSDIIILILLYTLHFFQLELGTMVDLQAYRAAIGRFNGRLHTVSNSISVRAATTTDKHGVLLGCLVLACSAVCLMQKLSSYQDGLQLLLSGDVELNPGPVTPTVTREESQLRKFC